MFLHHVLHALRHEFVMRDTMALNLVNLFCMPVNDVHASIRCMMHVVNF